MAIAWGAQGTTIAVDLTGANSNGNSTYTLVNNVVNLANIGGGEVGERDTTVLSSTVKTFAPTIPDNQEATIELLYDPTDNTHRTIRDWKDTPQAFAYWKCVPNTNSVNSNTNSSVIFQAFVKGFDGYNFDDVDANLTATFTIRKTGAVAWLPA